MCFYISLPLGTVLFHGADVGNRRAGVGRVPAHRCSAIAGCLLNRYIAESQSLDKVDVDYRDDRFVSVSQVSFSFKTIIPFPKCITNKIPRGSSSCQGRIGLLIK